MGLGGGGGLLQRNQSGEAPAQWAAHSHPVGCRLLSLRMHAIMGAGPSAGPGCAWATAHLGGGGLQVVLGFPQRGMKVLSTPVSWGGVLGPLA